MCGWVFICATATRPEASWPEPSPLVWLNHGRCAGAFAWVRTQTLCLPASALIASISSRALLESPPGAGAFIVTAIAFSPGDSGVSALLACKTNMPNPGRVIQSGSCRPGMAVLASLQPRRLIEVNARQRGPVSGGLEEVGDRPGETLRLVQVGNVPGAGELDVARALDRLVELAHRRR